MKKQQDRFEVILKWLEINGGYVDVLNRDFVDYFIAETGAPHRVTSYGAFKCPTLGSDLSTMARRYMLKRGRTGIEGMAGMGFPTWVYTYERYPY
jgi:hypothetical protein